MVRKKRKENSIGLRQPQVRVLKALAKSKAALNRSEISERGKVDQASLVEYIGSSDSKIRKANDSRKFKSLISLGHVRVAESDGRDTYSITPTGRKVLANGEAR